MESMERLIIKSKAGSLYFNDAEWGLKLEPHEIEPHQRRLLLKRLYAYEDTGLTPDQIMGDEGAKYTKRSHVRDIRRSGMRRRARCMDLPKLRSGI